MQELRKVRSSRPAPVISRLRQERLNRGWSLAHVGVLTRISPAQLSLIERGRMDAYPGWQVRLSKVLGVPAQDLFDGRAVRPGRAA